jgi:hypothetical protein
MTAEPKGICPGNADGDHCAHWGDGGECCACKQIQDDTCPDCGRAECTGEDCYWPDEAGLR